MSKTSVVINTLNEEKNLPRVLASVKGFADEIVICDMYSTDETVQIAKKAGAKVYRHKKEDYVELARNFSLSKAAGDWILVLDTDEEVPNALKVALKEIVQKDEVDYVKIPRKNIVFGKWLEHSRWWPDYIVRFFKKGKVSWSKSIHLPPETKGEGLELEAKEGNALVHYHYESVEQFLNRLNRYTTVQARLLLEQNYKFSWLDLIKKPADEFFSRYFFGQGYKDGLHGLAIASLQSFSELILYLKIWQEQGFSSEEVKIQEVIKEMRNSESHLHYWQADALLREGGGVIQRLKRKFRMA